MPKILAIDNNNDNLIILNAIIQDAFNDLHFFSALSGLTGIDLAISVDPDVILLDLNLPDLDGFEVCRRLKQDKRVRDIPVIFLTSLKENKEHGIKALELGADLLLSKPIDEIELIAQIRVMIKMKSAFLHKREENGRFSKLVDDHISEMQQNQIEMLSLLNDLKIENEARKKIEEELRQSEQKFRKLYESAGIGISYFTPNGTAISFNRIAAAQFHRQPEFFTGKTITEILPGEMANFFLDRIKQAASSELPQEFEDQVIIDGQAIWLLNIFNRILDNKDEVIGIQVISSDISKRKRAEEALLLNEARLHQAEIASKSGNWELHIDTLKMIASAGAALIYGVTEEQFEYEYVKNFPLDEYRPLLDQSLKNLINNHQPYHLEFKIQAADTGEIKDILSDAMFDSEKGIVFGIIQDITSQKQVELALRRSEILNRSLVEHLPQRIFIKDINSVYISCNAIYANDIGTTPDQVPGKTDFDFVPEWMALNYIADDQYVMSSGEMKIITEPYLTHGLERWIKTIKVPYHNELGKIIGVLGIFEDITENRKQQEALMNSEERFKNIYTRSPIAIELFDEKGYLVDVNPACCDLFGIQSVEVVKGFQLFDDPNIPKEKIELAQQGISIRYESEFDFDMVKKLNLYQTVRSGKVKLDVLITPIRKSSQSVFDFLVQIIDITERERALKALSRSEEQHRLLIQNLHAGLVVHAPDTSILLANEMATKLLGISIEQMMGKVASDHNWHFLNEDGSICPIENYPSTKTISSLQPLVDSVYGIDRLTTGDRIWVLVNAFPEFDNNHNLVQVVVTFLDITERRKTEQALLTEQARIRAITRAAQDAILMMDPDGKIHYFNPAAERIFGFTMDEVIGKNLHLLLAPQRFHLSHLQSYDNFLKTGRGSAIGKNVELEARCKDGREISIELSLSALELSEGWYAVGIIRDTTERKAIEKKINLLAHALVSISECVTITDNDDVIIYVNDSLLKTYGYTEEELIGKHIDILRPDNQTYQRVRDIFTETIEGGWRGEILNKRKDGSLFPILLSTSVIKNERNEPIALIGVAIDITEIRKNREELIVAKEKAEEGNRLKSAFLATMNHELRTPLNHILGFSDLILSGATVEECYNYTTFIRDSGKSLLSMIEDVFDLALVEHANIKLRNQTFSLLDLFIENKSILEENLKNSSKQEQIRLIYKPDANFLETYITADRSKINQVLSNLFKNAVKFTQQGTIEFGYKLEDTAILSFYIKDSGIGISKENQSIIFEFFRQVDDSITRNYGGIGVGLAISLKIAKILNGQLNVVSEPGQGSTFVLSIPVEVNEL